MQRRSRARRSGLAIFSNAVVPKSYARRDTPVEETRDLDENTILDLDADGNVCSITIEHASERAGAPEFSYEQVAASG